ncbi:MAG: hypothetical protein KKA42_09355, partial [candidate division Zixibacteria bacterium]|nr:hypothetical protein [candidate division Zixibacteria bacterium]
IGIGGWRPHSAEATAECRYGDCKDMSTLLISRFRQAGLTAYPCLVLTRGEGRTDPEHPGFAFNHVIAMLLYEGDTIWVDPTQNQCPFGTIPYSIEDIDVLVVTDNGGAMRHIRGSEPEDNQTNRTIAMHVGPDRIARSTMTLETKGQYARILRGNLIGANSDQTRNLIDRQFHGANQTYRILTRDVLGLEEMYDPVVVRVTCESVKPVRKLGSTVYCEPFFAEGLASFEDEDLTDRVFPLNTYYPDRNTTTIVVTWDSSLAADSICLPPDDSVSFDFGGFSCRSELTADTVRIALEKTCRTYQIMPERFDEFDEFRDRLDAMIKTRLKFIYH